MDVQTLSVERKVALDMWKKYQTHRHYQNPVDADIERIYKALANGKMIINAVGEVVRNGLNADGLPVLAIARADERHCFLTANSQGCNMAGVEWVTAQTSKTRQINIPLAIKTQRRMYKALVPHIPPDLRPKRGIQNYHILWEADWTMHAPIDPMLLRRHGEDMWVVVAAWDLTPVERAVMEMHANKRS